MRLVLIEWLDSFGCSSTWQELGNCATEPLVYKSVGWLPHDGDNCKVVVPHLAEESDVVKRQGCGDMTIPTKAIIAIKELQVPISENLQVGDGLATGRAAGCPLVIGTLYQCGTSSTSGAGIHSSIATNTPQPALGNGDW